MTPRRSVPSLVTPCLFLVTPAGSTPRRSVPPRRNAFDKAHAPGAASQGAEERGFGSNPVAASPSDRQPGPPAGHPPPPPTPRPHTRGGASPRLRPPACAGAVVPAPYHPHRMPARLSSPDLVGRDDALAALTSAIGAATAGPRFVIVRGEAGIGKTRLVREAIAQLRRRHARPASASASTSGPAASRTCRSSRPSGGLARTAATRRRSPRPLGTGRRSSPRSSRSSAPEATRRRAGDGEPPPTALPAHDGLAQARLFERVLGLLGALAERVAGRPGHRGRPLDRPRDPRPADVPRPEPHRRAARDRADLREHDLPRGHPILAWLAEIERVAVDGGRRSLRRLDRAGRRPPAAAHRRARRPGRRAGRPGRAPVRGQPAVRRGARTRREGDDGRAARLAGRGPPRAGRAARPGGTRGRRRGGGRGPPGRRAAAGAGPRDPRGGRGRRPCARRSTAGCWCSSGPRALPVPPRAAARGRRGRAPPGHASPPPRAVRAAASRPSPELADPSPAGAAGRARPPLRGGGPRRGGLRALDPGRRRGRGRPRLRGRPSPPRARAGPRAASSRRVPADTAGRIGAPAAHGRRRGSRPASPSGRSS